MLIDYIYPQSCGMCGKIGKRPICRKCEIRLSKKAVFGVENYESTTSYFDEHLYIFEYSGEIRDTIIKYKFNDKPYIYRTFAEFIESNSNMCEQIKKYDVIVPVPISKKRYKQRGYNQSGLFAKSLAKYLGSNYFENVLIKQKNNVEQSSLNQEDREKNVKGVYKVCNCKKIVDKKILIVDDIFTTGSTVNECSKTLIENGAREIGVLTIAKD